MTTSKCQQRRTFTKTWPMLLHSCHKNPTRIISPTLKKTIARPAKRIRPIDVVTPPDGLGPNERRREERGRGDDYRSYARVAAGYTMVARRTVRWTEGGRSAGALHRWLRLCPQDDGGQTQSFHDENMILQLKTAFSFVAASQLNSFQQLCSHNASICLCQVRKFCQPIEQSVILPVEPGFAWAVHRAVLFFYAAGCP